MKFLCRNCKAKYQIADEKVAGRTLRMTCQQCSEPIVVRGPSRAGGTAPVATVGTGTRVGAPAPIAVPAPASMLGHADLSHLTSAAPPASASEEWHVAINDSPVGPLRRDEVARKIAQGSIDRESLAWREGMDDWLAIKHIAELALLFAPQVAHATGATALGGRGGAAMNMQTAGLMAPAVSTMSTMSTARGDIAPIGGRQVVAAVPDYSEAAEYEPPEVAVATVSAATSPAMAAPAQFTAPVQYAAAAPAAPAAPQPGWAQMFALVSGGAFILLTGVLIGHKMLSSNNAPPPAAAPVVAPTQAAPPKTEEPAPAVAAQAEEPGEGNRNVIELDRTDIAGATPTRKPATGSSANTGSQANPKGKSGLSDEQKELLARMGGDHASDLPKLRVPSDAHPTGAQGAQLTAAQLQAVVLSGRKNLQRCYETALRGSNSNETVRLDVDIQVSPSGNVQTVRTSGKGLPGMDDCISRTVKMWRFPMSGEVTQTRFPVVFQPGA